MNQKKIDEYIAQRYDLAPSSKKTAAKHLRYWDKMLDGGDLEGVTVSDFEAWVEEKGWGNSMHYASLGVIQGYVKWAGWRSIRS